MTLAPIRGAPAGAGIPDFPAEEPKTEPMPAAAMPVPDDPCQLPPARQSYAPIDISGGDITMTFRVIPEQPAIARASMTIHVDAQSADQSTSHPIGSLQMSADAARTFLAGLRDRRSPIVATGDEDGTVEVMYEITDRGAMLSVRKTGGQDVLRRFLVDVESDVETLANNLLADLGA